MFLVALVVLPVTGCTAEGERAAPEFRPTTVTTATPTPNPKVVYAREAWERGPHSDTYALEKGPNTYCARCHSPANWDRSATIDPPPNCVSCKFPGEPEPRIAEGNPLVPEEEWESIDCAVCHRVDGGVVDPAIAWKDMETGYYETMRSSTELCTQCHRNTETLRHARPLGSGPHADFTCTDCHDPHDTSASCGDVGCHDSTALPLPTPLPEHADQVNNSDCTSCHNSVGDIHMNILEERPTKCMDCHGQLFAGNGNHKLRLGHSKFHADIACVACHDAAGLEVKPLEGEERWMTFRTTELLGRTQTEPYQSHQLTRSVDCSRCHAPTKSWGLPPITPEPVNGDE